MNAHRTFTWLLSAMLLALALAVGPAVAQEDDEEPAEEPVEQTEETGAEDEGHRISLTDTPRDRLGLLLLGALVIGTGIAFASGRRQMKGEHAQADGEFRWR